MKASELRIGNLINGIYYNYDDSDEEIELQTICKVVTLDVSGSGDYPIYVYSDEEIEHFSDFEPISLTEEWLNKSELEKLGTRDIWQKENFAIYYQRGPDAYSQYCKEKFYLFILDLSKNVVSTPFEIKYLHQLQNLYFSLEGKELTFKS